MSWGTERQTLSVNSLAAVVIGLDGEDSILLLRDSAAGVGDFDDVVKLLADVGGDNKSCLSCLGLLGAEKGVGSLLGLLGFFEVGVILHGQVINTKGEEWPIERCLSDVDGGFVLGVSADLGMGDGEVIGKGALKDGVESWLVLVLIARRLGGQ